MSDQKKPRHGGAADRYRVFVALCPAPPVRARLSEVADAIARTSERGRQVPAGSLHLTLAFIGSLQVDRAADLARRLDERRTAEFDWILDHVGYFAGARVIWAGGPENARLLALAANVRQLLDSMGIAYDPKPFAPHVTLLRNVFSWSPAPVPIAPPIVWPCSNPNLLRSQPAPHGVNYVAVARRP